MPKHTFTLGTDAAASRHAGREPLRIVSFVLVALMSLFLSAVQGLADESLQHFLSGTQPNELIQGANAYGEAVGSPPLVPVLSGGKAVGYAYLNTDFSSAVGYSGKPIRILVGIDPKGVIRGIKLVEHKEPIVLIGIPQEKVVAALNKKPMLLTFENPLTGKTERANADGATFTNLVYQLVFFNVTIAYIPPLITSVAHGESDVFSALVPELITSSEGMSLPLHYAVLCQDEIPYVDTDEVMQKVEDADGRQDVIDAEAGSMDMYFEICDAWDLTPSGEISNEPVVSNIPTLIITGRFDPITPTFDGEALLDDLSNAVLVEIPTASHDPLDTSGTCGVGMVTAFLDHPRKDLDTSCVDDLTLDMSPDDDSDTAGS